MKSTKNQSEDCERKRESEVNNLEKKTSWKVVLCLHILLFVYSLESVCSKMAAAQEMFSFKFFLFYGLVLFLLFRAMLFHMLFQKQRI